RHTRFSRDWSSDVCSSDLNLQKKNENELRKKIEEFRDKASKIAANSLAEFGINAPIDIIEKTIYDSINENTPDFGIKSVVDSQKIGRASCRERAETRGRGY